MEKKELEELAGDCLANLLSIGEVLFKDARDATPAEVKAVGKLMKEKFKKCKEEEQMSSVKVVKTYCQVKPKDQTSWCTVHIKEIADVLWDSEPNDEWDIKIIELTDEEFAALPEFQGW
jgi:hypothetical protein